MSAKVRDEVRGDIILTDTDLKAGRELAKAYRWYWGIHLPDDDATEPARVGWATIAREVRAVTGADLLDRNAALERDRALLLRFARAEKRCCTTPLAMPDHTYWEDAERERREAWNALRDAGLLGGDDEWP